jgi:hypothetical protein
MTPILGFDIASRVLTGVRIALWAQTKLDAWSCNETRFEVSLAIPLLGVISKIASFGSLREIAKPA